VDLRDRLRLLDLAPRLPQVVAELAQVLDHEADAALELLVHGELLELLEVGLHELGRLFLVQGCRIELLTNTRQ